MRASYVNSLRVISAKKRNQPLNYVRTNNEQRDADTNYEALWHCNYLKPKGFH